MNSASPIVLAKVSDTGSLSNALAKVEERLQLVGANANSRRLRKLHIAMDHSLLRLVVFGEFNRGKSTLINALLGREVLAAKLVPTTGHVTQVVFSQKEEVHVVFADGRRESHGLDHIATFSSLDVNGLARDDVESIIVKVNCPLLKSMILVDTPGINDRDAQTRRAKDAIAFADVVLLVLDARQLLSAHEQELAADWIGKTLDKTVIPVVNFMNFIDDRDREELTRRLDRWCQQHLRAEFELQWFAVNAIGALKHCLRGGAAVDDDFVKLRTALADCDKQKRLALQNRSRRGQLRYEILQTRVQNAAVLLKLRQDADKVKRERAALRDDLRDHARRFHGEANELWQRVSKAAQKALDAGIDELGTDVFRGQSKARLEANANRWYHEVLSDAVRRAEKVGQKRLLELAGAGLDRPEPLTVREKMILNARLHVGDLPPIAASGFSLARGVIIGLFLGTCIFPCVGTIIGAVVGFWLAQVFGAGKPNYPAAFTEKAREKWVADTRTVLCLLQSEFDGRVAELKQQIDQRLAAVEPGATPLEVSQREALDLALGQCEHELRAI